jgi:hypothetical protein
MDIKDYKSRWDYMADRSGVSRKPNLDAELTQFNIVGRFIGNWTHEVQYLIDKYKGGRGFNFLDKLGKSQQTGNLDIPYTAQLDQADMEAAQIPLDYKFAYKIDPGKLEFEKENIPTIWKMINWFEFTGLVLPKIHIQYPGQVFPFHFDDLTTHRNNSAADHDMDDDQEKFARVEVQLQDWDYGHVWGIGNNYWSSWKSGEIMWHPWRDVPHGTANSGKIPRINLQVTGGCTPEVIEKLKSNFGDIIL